MVFFRLRFLAGVASWQDSGCSVESIRVVWSVSTAWEAVKLTLGGCLHLPVIGLWPYRFGSDNRGCSRTNAWQFSTFLGFPRRSLPALFSKASTCACAREPLWPLIWPLIWPLVKFDSDNPSPAPHSRPHTTDPGHGYPGHGGLGRAILVSVILVTAILVTAIQATTILVMTVQVTAILV